jgi:hypothetical protein
MYFKKIEELPSLPEDLGKELYATALMLFEKFKDNVIYYRTFEREDTTSLNYINPEDIHLYEKSGGVTALPMPKELEDRVKDFYKQFNSPITDLFDYYGFLIVEGGTTCVPHIDDVVRRKNGFQYLLKSGGSEVKTVWYEPKDEFKDQKIKDYCAVPYSKLNVVTETCLEENNWYWMKFDTIHSVENQESIRFFLAGGKEGIIDYAHLVK